MFRKYMHVERFGNDEVQGIELGECYVFPKLDGTNASVWVNSWQNEEDVRLHAGSRRRELSIDEDNAGFFKFAYSSDRLQKFFFEYPYLRFYGEWLVPHTLKTYREDSWRKFYIFDVFDDQEQLYLHYNTYQPLLEEFGLDYIAPLCYMNNATHASLQIELQNNTYLIGDGQGAGEGIVIKNYDFQNRFGRMIWAKLIRNEFKEKHARNDPTKKLMKEMVEQQIVDKYITQSLVDKIYAKIVNDNEGWNSKYIPQLLNTVYYDLVNEEIWNVVKKFKNPTINFRTLGSLTTLRIKELKSELF